MNNANAVHKAEGKHWPAIRDRWAEVCFAAIACGIAYLLYRWLGQALAPEVSPFLYGMLAVIAVAVRTSFPPAVAATLASLAWCAASSAGSPSGSTRSLATSCLLFGAGGLFLSYRLTKTRRLAEAANRRALWDRGVIEQAGEGLWILDAAGFVVYSNPRINEILQLEPGGATGRNSGEFFFPEDAQAECVRNAALTPGRNNQRDRRLRRRDGSPVWVLASSTVCADDGNDSPGVVTVMTEIDERKRTEFALRRSEQRFRSLFEKVPQGVYRTSPEGSILEANPALLSLVGIRSDEEMVKLNVADLYVSPNVRRRLTSLLERDGAFHNVEYELRRHDGRLITVQENARVVRAEDGSVLYYEGTLTDVTDTRKKESQRHEAGQMSALCEMTGATARDLQRLLRRISLATEELAQSSLDEPSLNGRAREIQASVDRAGGLAGQVVAFAKRYGAGPSTIDLNRLLGDAKDDLRRVAGEVPVAVSFDEDEALPVHIDRAHAEFIAVRLLLYGLRTLEQGTPMELRAGAVEFGSDEAVGRIVLAGEMRPGAFALLTLTGFGWDPLRVNQSRKDESSRVGLDQMVTQYGGFSSIEHLEDGRTRFSVCLPRAAVGVAAKHSRESILLVDDDSLVRELSKELLELEGYTVTVADGAKEAEQVIARGVHVDLLLTDVMMPNVTGPTLARKLREIQPKIKVLFVSAFASRQVQDGTLIRDDIFLAKPFSADALTKKIREILDSPSSFSASAAT